MNLVDTVPLRNDDTSFRRLSFNGRGGAARRQELAACGSDHGLRFRHVVPLIGGPVREFDFSDLVDGRLRLSVKALYGGGTERGPRKHGDYKVGRLVHDVLSERCWITRAVDAVACTICDGSGTKGL